MRKGSTDPLKYADGILFLGASVFWMVAVGFFGHWFTGSLFRQRRAAESYVLVQARVLKAAVGSTGSDQSISYHPVVTYEYDVEGQTYSSSRYAYVSDGFVLHRGLPGLALPISFFALFMSIGVVILGVGVHKIRAAARESPPSSRGGCASTRRSIRTAGSGAGPRARRP